MRSSDPVMASDNTSPRKLSEPVEAALMELVVAAEMSSCEADPLVTDALERVREEICTAWPTWPHGQPMGGAPRDGSAFLATGVHDQDDPPGAARGVKAGYRWWAILLFDIWREPHRFVFAKDGAEPWSEPQLWCALPDLLPGDPAPHVLPAAMTPAIAKVLGLQIFQTAPLGHLYRAAGEAIRPKVEEEQAFVLFRFLHLALQHGPDWFEASCADVEAARDAAATRLPAVPSSDGDPL